MKVLDGDRQRTDGGHQVCPDDKLLWTSSCHEGRRTEVLEVCPWTSDCSRPREHGGGPSSSGADEDRTRLLLVLITHVSESCSRVFHICSPGPACEKYHRPLQAVPSCPVPSRPVLVVT